MNDINSPSDKYDISINGNSITVTINSLMPGATYHWQVKAENNGPFISEGPIKKFVVTNN